MRCSRVKLLYEEYASGALPLATADRIDAHLTRCACCRDEFESNDALSVLLTRGVVVAHPGDAYLTDAADRAMAAIFDSAGGLRRDRPPDEISLNGAPKADRFKWWTAAAAAGLLFALTVSSLLSDATAPNRSPRSPMLVEAPLRSVSSDRELFKGIDDRRDSAEPATAQVALQASAVAWESPIAATPLATLEISKYIPTGARLQDDELTIFYREISKMEMAFAADPNRPGQLMLVQANHFWRGEREYQRRSIAQAIECFERVLDLDRHSSLAQRACYRLARIYYDELADFERAQPVYAECLGSVDDGLFSGEETRDIRLRSLRLTQYADCEWRPLNDLREIRLSPWPDVPRAVERLARDPRSLELIPEAADFVVRRVTEAPREIDAQLARLLIEIISEPVEALANDESRARVYLAIGDIHLNKFNDLNRSLAAYDRALELARETSWAPQIRERARMIRTSLLDPPGRRR